MPESVGDAEVCVRLENSVVRPFTIFYRTSDSTAQSTLIVSFHFFSYRTFVYVTVTSFEFLLSLGAIDPVDYSSVTGDFEYQIGGGFRCILVAINDDTVPETTEAFTVNFFLDFLGRGAVNPSVGIIDNDQIGMSTIHTKCTIFLISQVQCKQVHKSFN